MKIIKIIGSKDNQKQEFGYYSTLFEAERDLQLLKTKYLRWDLKIEKNY